MKKRFATILLTTTLSMSLIGCGITDLLPGKPGKEETTETAKPDEVQTAEADKPEEDNTENSESESGSKGFRAQAEDDDEISSVESPEFIISTEYFYEPDNSGLVDTPVFTGHVDSISLTEESKAAFPELDSSFSEYASETTASGYKYLDISLDSSKKERLDVIEEIENGEDSFIYTGTSDMYYYIQRADSACVSIISAQGGYASVRERGYTRFNPENFDSQTGKKLTLSDVITDRDSFRDGLIESLYADYGFEAFSDDFADKDSFEEAIDGFIESGYHPDTPAEDEYGIARIFRWFFDTSGLTVLFNTYAIAPYDYGTITETFPYSSGLINDKYIPDDNSSFITEVGPEVPINIDTNGDGVIERYYLWCDHAEDHRETGYEDYVGYSISCYDIDIFSDEDYFFDYSTYLTKVSDKYFLILNSTTVDDHENFYCFEIFDGGVVGKNVWSVSEKAGFYNDADDIYYTHCLTDASGMKLGTKIDLLSTYDGVKKYHLKDDGTLQTESDMYDVSVSYTLISTADITGDVLDEDGNVIESRTIPSGTGFNIIRTDGKNIVDTEIDDGSIVRLTIDTSESGLYFEKLGGVTIDKLFEELYFAG